MLAHLELRHHLCPRRLSSCNVPSAADEVCADVRRYVAAPRQYVTPFDSRSDTDVLADRYGELRVSGRFSWRAQLVCQRCGRAKDGRGGRRRRTAARSTAAAPRLRCARAGRPGPQGARRLVAAHEAWRAAFPTMELDDLKTEKPKAPQALAGCKLPVVEARASGPSRRTPGGSARVRWSKRVSA